MSKKVGCTPTSFLLLSIHSSSASVAWQSLLLMLTSIDGHLHSSLISLVNMKLSSFFCLLPTTSIIILYSTHSTISMAYAHVLHESSKKLKRIKKYEPIAWLKPGLCMMGVFCVMKKKHSLTI